MVQGYQNVGAAEISEGKEKRMVRIARFRTGCEMRESRYYEREENRKYRICE